MRKYLYNINIPRIFINNYHTKSKIWHNIRTNWNIKISYFKYPIKSFYINILI